MVHLKECSIICFSYLFKTKIGIYSDFSEDVLINSGVGVSTQITSVGKLLPSSTATLPSEDRPSTSSADRSLSSVDDSTLQEGWQKFWDEPPAQVQGIPPSNVRWLKTDGPYGIFESAKMYTTAKGEFGTRQIFKKKMEFNPPPLPTSVKRVLAIYAVFLHHSCPLLETSWSDGDQDEVPQSKVSCSTRKLPDQKRLWKHC